ncbi:MAG: aminoacyl--tRNA ligase-related protein [Acidimicrobiia bacterium]|nr:aminoacyl--tRNA ligase-related protein [Acidimicrobiia bacterium]
MEVDGDTSYYLKPMNCPFHILIFKNRMRSYRELPLRMFEFGSVYRYERPGVVHGLTARRAASPRTTATSSARPSRCPTRSRRCSSSCSTCCGASASTTSRPSSPPDPGEGGRAPTRSGSEATEALRRRARATGPRRYDHRRGRRRLLRAEDRRADARDAIGRCLAALDASRSTSSSPALRA